MEVQVLGAHLAEVKGARLTSLLIDGVLAVDAGGITSALSLPEQQKIETVLLTHHHFDHTRDLVTLAANNGYYWRKQLAVCAPRYTLDIVSGCLLNGQIYANFFEYPSKEKPTVILEAIEPYSRKTISGYDVLAMPVRHSVPAVGYQIIQHSTDLSAGLFYTGDTTVGVSDCWRHISPRLLITEVAGPNRYEDWLTKAGHLCPRLLREELIQFRRLKGYLPRIIVIHIGNPYGNATMESFFKTLKHAEVNLCQYETYQDVVTRLPYFLEDDDNHKRLHSALGYRSPDEFEEELLNQENNDEPRQTLLTLCVQSQGCSLLFPCSLSLVKVGARQSSITRPRKVALFG